MAFDERQLRELARDAILDTDGCGVATKVWNELERDHRNAGNPKQISPNELSNAFGGVLDGSKYDADRRYYAGEARLPVLGTGIGPTGRVDGLTSVDLSLYPPNGIDAQNHKLVLAEFKFLESKNSAPKVVSWTCFPQHDYSPSRQLR